MSDLQFFTFDGAQVRTIAAEGDRPELFVAADLCALLDFRDPTDAVSNHVEPEDRILLDLRSAVSAGRADSDFDLALVDHAPESGPPAVITDSDHRSRRSRDAAERIVAGRADSGRLPVALPGRGAQRLLMVTEPGAWALMFAAPSPHARAVRRWLGREVLPALRARGAYALPDAAAALLATLTAAQLALDAQAESDLRHGERAVIADGPAGEAERERQLREVCALDDTRRMLTEEIERWSASLPEGAAVPVPRSVADLLEHLRVTRGRGGRTVPQLPENAVIID